MLFTPLEYFNELFLLLLFGAVRLVLYEFCVQYFLKKLSCYSSLVIPDSDRRITGVLPECREYIFLVTVFLDLLL